LLKANLGAFTTMIFIRFFFAPHRGKVYFVTLTGNVLNLLDCEKKCISQLSNFLIGEPIEELANLSNYRYFV